MRIADTAAALTVAALGGITIYQARQLPYSAEYGPGAGFLPLWLGIVLVILSLFLVRNALRAAVPTAPQITDDASTVIDPPTSLDRRTWIPWLIFFGSTVALALLFEPLGLWVSTALFTFITVRWVAHRAWLPTLVFAVLTPILLYIGFVRLLLVPLPLSPFGS